MLENTERESDSDSGNVAYADLTQKALSAKYSGLIKEIKDGGKFCFLTIAPKPNPKLSMEGTLKPWLDEFASLAKYGFKFVMTIELTKKCQPHFHAYLRTTSRYEYRLKQLIYKWYHKAVIEPIWGYMPKDGQDYIFKECMYTQKVIERCPVYTHDNFI